jgi:hypothetical protein
VVAGNQKQEKFAPEMTKTEVASRSRPALLIKERTRIGIGKIRILNK